MAKKRLTFDVEEDLHSNLKQEAAKRGLPLGALCSTLLEKGLGEETTTRTSVEIDPELFSSLPLDYLRGEVARLGAEKPKDWQLTVRRINSEIVKRYIAR